MSQDDPTISAVVVIRPPQERALGGPLPQQGHAAEDMLKSLGISVDEAAPARAPGSSEAPSEAVVIDRLKMFFTRNGFEVHAPLGMTFSIAGPVSQFQLFGDLITVDNETFPASVKIEGGGNQLTLDTLPDDMRGIIESISFPPPMDFPG